MRTNTPPWREAATRRAANPPTRHPWGEDVVPLSPRVDTYVTGPTPPESSRAQAALVSNERVMDAFAASAKAERRRQKIRRKNHQRREESRRRAGEVLLSRGHVDGWGCSRELDGGGQAGAAAAGWTEEPTAASCSRDDTSAAESMPQDRKG